MYKHNVWSICRVLYGKNNGAHGYYFGAQAVIRCVDCLVWLREKLKSNVVMMSGKGLNIFVVINECRYNRGV